MGAGIQMAENLPSVSRTVNTGTVYNSVSLLFQATWHFTRTLNYIIQELHHCKNIPYHCVLTV